MEFATRKFISDSEVVEIGEGLLSHTLPKERWTHEAHFAAVVYLLRSYPHRNLEVELPLIISSYNESQGGQNTDTSGYHETLTQFNLRLIRDFLRKAGKDVSLVEICNELVSSPVADREHPLKFYSRELLFSITARKQWVKPDLLQPNWIL